MHRGLRGAKFTATTLAQVRRRGWAATAAEREPGVASVSAPVRGPGGRVIAAVSVSGPIERLTRSPGRLHAPAVVGAGDKISKLLRAEYEAPKAHTREPKGGAAWTEERGTSDEGRERLGARGERHSPGGESRKTEYPAWWRERSARLD